MREHVCENRARETDRLKDRMGVVSSKPMGGLRTCGESL